MPRLDHDLGLPSINACWQGSANDNSVQDRTGVRGASSQPLAHRVSMHLGALVLCRGSSDRKLLSVLNNVARGRQRWRSLHERWVAIPAGFEPATLRVEI